MLHEILETIPFDSLAAKPSLDDWLGRVPIKEVFDAAIARGGIIMTAGHRRRAGEMIRRRHSLTSIPLGSVRPIRGLHECKNVISEMEFLFPFPRISIRSTDPRPGKLVIDRGYIKGFVDLVVGATRAGFISRTGR